MAGRGPVEDRVQSAAGLATTAVSSPGLRPVLTGKELNRLAALEEVIRRELDSFLQVAEALLEVRKERLYRERYPTFEEYCERQWDMSARRARQILAASQVVENLRLPENVGAVLPVTESQARPLSRLAPEEQRPAWDAAVAAAEERGTPVTAADAESAVRKIVEAKKPKEVLPPEDEWPKPNEHGAYSAEGSQAVVFQHALAWAEVRTLQIGKADWICACSYSYKTGTRQQRLAPLERAAGREFCTSQAQALICGLKQLRALAEVVMRGWSGYKAQKKVAAMMSRWCAGQLKEAGAVVDVPREAAKVEKKPVAVEQFSMVAERAGHLSAGIRLYVKTIRELPRDMSERFGQAVYFLDCARTELDRLALGGKAAADFPTAAKSKKSRDFDYCQKNWRNGTDKSFVICRKPRAGVVGDKLRFWSGPNSWTNSPVRAKHLSKADAVARLARTGKWDSCKGDVVMSYDKAAKAAGARGRALTAAMMASVKKAKAKAAKKGRK